MLPDIDRVSAILRDVAETEILPRFRSLDPSDIREKGPGDLVTVADEASERALTARLMDLLPGSVVVGEEAVAAEASVMDRISGDAPVWIVDPIDGTINFANGRETFGVMVALVRRGETLAGWIHDPTGGRTASVERGQGAWLDGRRLAASPAAALGEMSGFLSTRFFAPELRAHLERRRPAFASALSLGCAAHEYLRVASGEAHFALYRKLMPWDHAAGALLHAEAGGWHARLDGSPYGPAVHGGGMLVAPDRESWAAIRAALLDGAPGLPLED
jgi:fructose-1,6-bisphosphatase/inositol monophosphatase family enzyme